MKNEKDETKTLIFAIIFTIAITVFVIGIMKADSGAKKNTIKDFKTITIDGEEYDTRDIKEVKSGGYSGAVVITLKDGTEIHTTSYTLKN